MSRRLLLSAALGLAACSRSFVAQGPAHPVVSSIQLAGRSPLADGEIVLAGETVTLKGELLAGATVAIGGTPATAIDSATDHVDVLVPAPTSSNLGVPSEVDLTVAGTTLVAGHVTLYATPTLASAASVPAVGGAPDGGTEMVAPGLAVLEGENFSPRAEEDLVTFDGSAATVILAEPGRLLVNLGATLPAGPIALSLKVVPSPGLIGADRIAGQLGSARRAYLWEVVPDSWVSPPAAFGRQAITFRAGEFPTALAGALDTYGQAALVAADGGLPSSPPLLTLPYVPDDGLDFATNVASVGGAGPANSELQVCIDAVPSDAVEVQFSNQGLTWSFQLPANYLPGAHQIQLQDPAAANGASTLIGLVGHPPQPTLTCFALTNWVGANVEAEPLASAASQGTQLGVFFPHLPDGGPLACDGTPAASGMSVRMARYEPGGALDDPFCKAVDGSSLASFTALPTNPIGAGRHRVYLSDGESPSLLVVPSFSQPDGGPADLVINPSPSSGLVPVAVKEPTLEDGWLWVASSTAPTAPLASLALMAWPLTANPATDPATAIGSVTTFIGPGDAACTHPSLVATAFIAEVLNVAVACDSTVHPGFRELSLGRLVLPDPTQASGAGSTLTPVWRRIQIDPTKVGPSWTAQLGFQTTLVVTSPPDVLRPGVVVSDNFIRDDPFGFPLQPVPGETILVGQAALAPDGQQALVVPADRSRVEIFEPQTDPGSDVPQWRQFGSFSVPTNFEAGRVVYDASGSQAVVLLQPVVDGGLVNGPMGGYCVLH